jgi:DNA mismatch repair protein MutS2
MEGVMRTELRKFVLERGFELFSESVPNVRTSGIFQTKDAQSVYMKVLRKISKFEFAAGFGIWNFFGMNVDENGIFDRQEFFKAVAKKQWFAGGLLKKISRPRKSWTPKYDVAVVTESEESFVKLKDLACSVVLLTSENDIADLERYDIVQVVDCDDFCGILERLPQSVFVNSIEDVYLERFLEMLSGWRENFAILNGVDVSRELRDIMDMLIEPFALLENKEGRILTEGEVESALEDINENIGERIKGRMISGEDMMKMLSEGKMGEDLLDIVRKSVEETGLPEHIFNIGIPVSIDYKELEEQIRLRSASEYTEVAENIKRNASKLRGIPDILRMFEAEIMIEDFCCGLSGYLRGVDGEVDRVRWPRIEGELLLEDCLNLFLKNPQAVSFVLNAEHRGSILTGANSGGKTTLLEHVLQNVVLMKLGLGVDGVFRSLNFEQIYYFAKNKGSTNKGAFETLLTQMANIGAGETGMDGTLILADEIESVTEPGVAGKIIAATAEYFVSRGAYVVMATHLGAEIAKSVPDGVRIDGIEARGLDENLNLIVNHNPVLGRLASSTPELIIERMARGGAGKGKGDSRYFEFLFERMKGH